MDGDAAFCSRCGTRVHTPKPADRREYSLIRIFPSWWRFRGNFFLAALLLIASAALVTKAPAGLPAVRLAVLPLALSFLLALATIFIRRGTSWSITSERLIEYRGVLLRRRREVELADIRSVEVDRRLGQRMLGLGNVKVATAASTDFLITLEDVVHPDDIAETLRRARLKRLA